MEYSGRLFGKVGKSYIPLEQSSKDIDDLKKLLRETVMRAHLAMPENKQDEKWFDDERMDHVFIQRVYEVLKLGKKE